MANEEPRIPDDSDGWQEYHLSDSQIRGLITSHFRSLGYDVKPGTLRIYGYDVHRHAELSAFQGHIALKAKPKP